MKKILIAGSLLLTACFVNGQQKEGKVTYERATNMEMRMNINGQEQVIPQNRKENFELHYAGNKSLWKAAGEEQQDDGAGAAATEGMQIRMVVAGSNDVLFTDIETGKKTEKKELFDKTFIVDDSVNKLKWKMSGETKTILGHNCMKATSSRIQTSTRMTMDNGKMERKEITDTSAIIAWFTTEIPASFGPGEFQGQLPGLILEMDISNGRQHYTATAIAEKADVASIKEPSGKKHYTPDEFKKEREKMMKEMQENMGGGGGHQIKINN
jgi:GLPGLI family protein